MRTRFLSVIVAFLLVSVAVSSCLNSDNNLEYTTDATISSFSLDTIYGVDYKFEIDQLNNLIYNPDSLPVSADTIIDSIMVDQLGAVWGVTSADTTFSTETYHNLLPAMNATGDNGVKLTVYGGDALSTRTYTLQIRVHRQDPDSLTWVHMDTVGAIFSTAVNQGEQKAVALNGEVRLALYVADRNVSHIGCPRSLWLDPERRERTARRSRHQLAHRLRRQTLYAG